MAAAVEVTIGVPAHAGEQDIGGTLASLLASVARARRSFEIVVAVNGPGDPSCAVAGAEAFARAAGLALVRGGGEAATGPAATTRLVLLRLPRASKVLAWNAIRVVARAPVVVFADADVRVSPDAIGILLDRLDADATLAVAAGRECARLEPHDGLAARMAALPHRFDFGNVPGRLYALRTAALPEEMPATVLHEDAYLTVRLGRERFVKATDAVVYLRPPATWREALRQRVRNEIGKRQVARDYPALYRAHGFGRYPWRRFLGAIALREYPLVALLLATRLWGAMRARRAMRGGIDTGWAVLPSTKQWSAGDAGATSGSGANAGAATAAARRATAGP